MSDLTKLREEIDKIDDELVALFERRMKISKKVAEYKKINNIPIYDEARENEIIEKNVDKLKDKSLSNGLEEFYKMIFKLSRDLQKREIEKNIVLIGMPGCGKTTIGRELAKKLKVRFYDSDRHIEKTTGKSISEIFENGEEHFRQLETETIKKLALKLHCVISTGGGIVKKAENIEVLKKRGTIIFVNRPLEKIVESINISKRPLLKDNKENLCKLYDERIELYKKYCDYEIENDTNIYNAVNKVLSILTMARV